MIEILAILFSSAVWAGPLPQGEQEIGRAFTDAFKAMRKGPVPVAQLEAMVAPAIDKQRQLSHAPVESDDAGAAPGTRSTPGVDGSQFETELKFRGPVSPAETKRRKR